MTGQESVIKITNQPRPYRRPYRRPYSLPSLPPLSFSFSSLPRSLAPTLGRFSLPSPTLSLFALCLPSYYTLLTPFLSPLLTPPYSLSLFPLPSPASLTLSSLLYHILTLATLAPQTSASTCKPKGVVHTTGGYLFCAALTVKYIFDVHERDRFACMADMG
ncbi:Acetyl-coenzyme A synthetase [Mycena venus]|uniref:Acetyl-coenzyme A synthetase n=1 Tax=Mycena venus TaxID=2733690 RepID=A0A8H7CRU8_9AGAR|nr:Acetyl-coenzyme A synthetase [Mycena venus]